MSEPLVGYRAWGMRAGSNGLFGVYFNSEPWHVGVTEATCKTFIAREHVPTHASPDLDCECGLHARTTLDGLLDEYPNYPMSNKGRWNAGKYVDRYKTLIFGAVLMWGNICRGERVIRAQFAQPICFTTIPHKQRSVHDWDELAHNVSVAYSVPIVDWEHLQTYAAEFGELLDIPPPIT